MEILWRRAVEVASVIGFGLTAYHASSDELRWSSAGAFFTALACILIYETMLTRQDRWHLARHDQLRSALADSEQENRQLSQKIETLMDGELLAIYKEDERERLRAKREHLEREQRSQHEAMDAARKNAFEGGQFFDDYARKHFGLDS